MARSPFQGTFRPSVRPTVVTAPDAMVFINGETEVIGCPSCKRRFPFNRYVTSIQVDLSVDSCPGSASINMSIPRHSVDDFYYEGNAVITPMMEVEIYMKGHYLLEGIPQYYPVFWGLITEVGDNYSGGEHSVSLNCSDILKWWELCRMNINPAYTAAKGMQGWSIFGNVMFGKNPYDLIWTLAQHSMGDVVVGTGSLVSMMKETGIQKPVFDNALSDMMIYWEERFGRIRSNIMLYGVNGVAVRGDTLQEMAKNKKSEFQGLASNAVAAANGGKDAAQLVFDPTSPDVVAFRTQGTQAGQINLWQSEYQTKLEIANACKEVVGFEFFMDVSGDIVFKPPFYNLDILSNKPVSWIQDIDIIEWDFSESEAEVITQIQMQGNFTGNIDWGLSEECTPNTSVTDYHLLRKYGWRVQNYNSEFMASPQLMFYHGMDLLDRINSKRHRGTVGIPLRPELRLGFPIYVAPKDQIWYISGISHNITFGGRAQTTLTLTAKRNKFIAPKGIGTLDLTHISGKPALNAPKDSLFQYSATQLSHNATYTLKLSSVGTANLPPTVAALKKAGNNNPYDPLILRHPKTGRLLGFPNVVMVYRQPFLPTEAALQDNKGERSKDSPNPELAKKEQEIADVRISANLARTNDAFKANSKDSIRERFLVNRYPYGMTSAGVYVYAYDKSDKAKIGEFVLLPASKLTATAEDQKAKISFGQQSVMIRPVSDERGFEVVGHFRYGRGVSLRDGRLITQAGKNTAAQIGTQLSVSGDMFATLEAQSQGLTSITTSYESPAAAITGLAPDGSDLQSGAIQTPGMGKPEFVTRKDNFVDTAPLGSAAQKGFPTSVEASQLSKSLTLAEMSILEGDLSGGDKCSCVVGRSDLAFISTGYQLQQVPILAGGSTTEDTSSLPGSTTTTGAATGTAGQTPAPAPVTGDMVALSPSQAATKINNFLFSLYKALDEPHVQWEGGLRGDLLFKNQTEGGYNPSDNEVIPPPSQLNPPWSAGGRYDTGDPRVIAQQGSSAVQDLTNTWNSFSQDAQASAERTYWTQKLSTDQSNLSSLQLQLTNAMKVNPPSSPERIAKLKQEIADKQQDIAVDQAKIAALPPG